MTRMQRTLLSLSLLALACGGAPGGALAAGIKCWTNDQGVRECGNAVPPEYAQKKHEELNKTGITVNETERAKTAEELAAEREREKQREEQERLAKQRAERDRVLLSTFTTEEDLLLARDSRLQAIDARIKHTREFMAKMEQTLQDMQAQAAEQERSGKGVSDDLKRELDDLQRQIQEQREFIEKSEQEKAEVRETFAEDLARYRELKRTQAQD